MLNCFFAYSDKGHKVSNSINEAIDSLKGNDLISIEPWSDMSVDGTIISSTVINSIDKCDVFLCDITNLNDNVLYELGYAIAKNKPIRIFINTSFDGTLENFKRLDILSPVAYVDYSYSNILSNKLWNLTEGIQKSILSKFQENNLYKQSRPLLYMKNIRESEQSSWITREINKSYPSHSCDDPEESVNQSLEWYINELTYSNGFIAYFQSDLEGAALRNNKISLVAGIAHGFELPTLLLSSSNYVPPLDFKTKVHVIDDKKGCEECLHNWFLENESILSKDKSTSLSHDKLRMQGKLRSLNFGQNVAEYETEDLLQYFVETNAFREVQNNNLSLFVGRKGVGKTANLLKLNDSFKASHNHICVIKPVQYEIDGIIEIMKELSPAEKGYLVQSIWKYLLYTELIKCIYLTLMKRPSFVNSNESEKEIIDFVEKNNSIVMAEFAERTQNAINQIKESNKNFQGNKPFNQRISELLHNTIIPRIRKLLSDYCGSKERIIILIDNLDKSWSIGADIELLSKFLYGLLEVGDKIIYDFSKDSNWNKRINTTLVVFLREDIFAVMKKYIPEVDKLQISKMVWDDEELLLRVIEERMHVNNDVNGWDTFFCEKVDSIPTKEYLISHILPKPRDLITLVNGALENAVNRKHSRIEEDDIIDAVEKYSAFAKSTLITELQVEYPQIEQFLLELLGENSIQDEDTLRALIDKVGIKGDKDYFLSLLCQMSFLGLEIKSSQFMYCYDIEDYKKYTTLAKKLCEKNNSVKRFKIHPAFYADLMIEK